MAVVTQQAEQIPKLEERIKELATTRDAVRADIDALREQVTILTLENEVTALEEEVNRLLSEKKTLEEKVACFDPPEEVEDIETANWVLVRYLLEDGTNGVARLRTEASLSSLSFSLLRYETFSIRASYLLSKIFTSPSLLTFSIDD